MTQDESNAQFISFNRPSINFSEYHSFDWVVASCILQLLSLSS
ncbi:MAG TPA: hypothetical protein VEN30_14775 [Paraburkholderia sp.]|nr:hypothetical protein [Paraburkholderia sp.]